MDGPLIVDPATGYTYRVGPEPAPDTLDTMNAHAGRVTGSSAPLTYTPVPVAEFASAFRHVPEDGVEVDTTTDGVTQRPAASTMRAHVDLLDLQPQDQEVDTNEEHYVTFVPVTDALARAQQAYAARLLTEQSPCTDGAGMTDGQQAVVDTARTKRLTQRVKPQDNSHTAGRDAAGSLPVASTAARLEHIKALTRRMERVREAGQAQGGSSAHDGLSPAAATGRARPQRRLTPANAHGGSVYQAMQHLAKTTGAPVSMNAKAPEAHTTHLQHGTHVVEGTARAQQPTKRVVQSKSANVQSGWSTNVNALKGTVSGVAPRTSRLQTPAHTPAQAPDVQLLRRPDYDVMAAAQMNHVTHPDKTATPAAPAPSVVQHALAAASAAVVRQAAARPSSVQQRDASGHVVPEHLRAGLASASRPIMRPVRQAPRPVQQHDAQGYGVPEQVLQHVAVRTTRLPAQQHKVMNPTAKLETDLASGLQDLRVPVEHSTMARRLRDVANTSHGKTHVQQLALAHSNSATHAMPARQRRVVAQPQQENVVELQYESGATAHQSQGIPRALQHQVHTPRSAGVHSAHVDANARAAAVPKRRVAITTPRAPEQVASVHLHNQTPSKSIVAMQRLARTNTVTGSNSTELQYHTQLAPWSTPKTRAAPRAVTQSLHQHDGDAAHTVAHTTGVRKAPVESLASVSAYVDPTYDMTVSPHVDTPVVKALRQAARVAGDKYRLPTVVETERMLPTHDTMVQPVRDWYMDDDTSTIVTDVDVERMSAMGDFGPDDDDDE